MKKFFATIRHGTQIELNRISETQYQVRTVNGSTPTLDLIFQNDLATSPITVTKTNVTLPYTYTITTDFPSGSTLRVKTGLGNWVYEWKIYVPLNDYLEAQNFTDLDLNDYMMLRHRFYSGDASGILFAKSITGASNRWMIYNQATNGLAFWSINSGTQTFLFTKKPVSGIKDYKNEISGSGINITYDGTAYSGTLDVNQLAYTVTDKKFRIGREYSGDPRRTELDVLRYEHGTEIFKIKEGTGTTTTGTLGTVLNLSSGCQWQRT